jgi:ribokinase
MLDVLVPAPARPVQHAPVEIRAGGSAVNAARACRAAGASAAVVGCVGDDPLAEVLRDELRREGIEARLTPVVGARTGRVVATREAIVAERGANAAFSAAALGALDADVVLVSGYQLFRGDSGPAAAEALRADAVIGVDLGSARLVASFGAARAGALLARVDVVLGNDDAVTALGRLEGPTVVTTRGPAGAAASGETAAPPSVIDAPLFGAGDAFAAGFLLAFAEHAPVAQCLQRGCELAGHAQRLP